MTVFTDNAAAFATQADWAITAHRRAAVTDAVQVLVASPYPRDIRRDQVLHMMLRSVHRQARMSGVNVAYPLLVRVLGVLS